MSNFFEQDVKERVRQAVDIVDLVGSYLELRRSGPGFSALCPWHDDSKPSLQVNPARQSWKCWVCNIGGDVFSFVQQREGVGFRQALEMLAQRAGIELPQQRQAAKTKAGDPNDKPTLYRAAAWAEEQFHQALLNSEQAAPARRYLAERGINRESVERHRIGFAPTGWDFLTRMGPANGFSEPVLEAVNLAVQGSRGYYDRFRGRLMFPIRDIESRPIAFGGRIIPELQSGEEAKYLNSSETRLFSKSENLYALDLVREAVRKDHHLVIVEGYTDVVAAFQAGLKNVVAVLGTALGERHLKLMRRLFADRLTLVLDGDEAGQKTADRVLELFVSRQLDLRVATLPGGMDPADYFQREGLDRFRSLLDEAPDALEHKLLRLNRRLGPNPGLHQVNEAIEEMLQLLASVPTGLEQSGPSRLRVAQVMSRIARQFQLNEQQLRERIAVIRSAGRSIRSEQARVQNSGSPPVSAEPLAVKDAELLKILIQNPSLVPIARDAIKVSELVTEQARQIYQTLITLDQAGVTPHFHQLMNTLDDPQYKSLIVELDELATKMSEETSESPEARLEQLIKKHRTQQSWSHNQKLVFELESNSTDQSQELDILQQCLELQRKRQGITDPTDG
ncbi:MAG: DNA primase [Planctomycetales bacterium]|nr:DNA primase [Planctomycetales bacterium]